MDTDLPVPVGQGPDRQGIVKVFGFLGVDGEGRHLPEVFAIAVFFGVYFLRKSHGGFFCFLGVAFGQLEFAHDVVAHHLAVFAHDLGQLVAALPLRLQEMLLEQVVQQFIDHVLARLAGDAQRGGHLPVVVGGAAVLKEIIHDLLLDGALFHSGYLISFAFQHG